MHIVNLHGMVISTAPNAHIYSRDLSNCNFIKTNQDTHQRTLDIRFADAVPSRAGLVKHARGSYTMLSDLAGDDTEGSTSF